MMIRVSRVDLMGKIPYEELVERDEYEKKGFMS